MLTAAVMNSKLASLDYAVIAAFLVGTLAVGLFFSKRARRDTSSYFKGAGTLPWWLLGTSMVATTFAADTPLALAGMVVQDGISTNWFWWSQVPYVIGGVFFFAHLWRRANPMTDMEFVDQRYSGREAHLLRGFKAGYLAIVYNTIVMGWVNKAMGTVLNHIFPELPRVPILDKILYAIIIATPISSNVTAGTHKIIHDEAAAGKSFLVVYDELRDNLYAEGARRGEIVRFETNEDVARWTAPQIALWTQVLNDYGIDLNAPQMNADQTAFDVEDDAYTSLHFARDAKALNSSLNQFKILLALFLLVLAYTAISGLWDVVVTDFIQFWIAMFGCIYLAVAAVSHLGGMGAMLDQMNMLYPDRAQHMISILPNFTGENGSYRIAEFVLYILVAWWATGFTDGGSFFAQRLLSAKNGFHGAMGYLWYAVAHFGLRMWPWLIVGFAAAVMFPYAPGRGIDPEAGYIKVMLAVLGPGMLGLMVASFFSAYMSTISTHLNLGASYLVNDLYRPYIVKNRSEKHYLRAGVAMTVVCAGLGMLVSLFMTSIIGAWFLLAGFNAGIGIIYILRWYWWRINAWSEIVCIASLIVITAIAHFLPEMLRLSDEATAQYNRYAGYPFSLLYALPLSFALSMIVTFATRPVEREKLKTFYRRVQSGGPGWRRIEREIRNDEPNFRPATPLRPVNFLNWALGTFTVYSYLWGIGQIIVGRVPGVDYIINPRLNGVILIIIGTAFLAWLIKSLRNEPIVEEDVERSS